MSIRIPLIVSLVLLTLMTAGSLWAFATFPNQIHIAVHWGINGMPDSYAGRTKALIILPAIGAVMTLVLALLPKLEPRRRNLIASRKFFAVSWIANMSVLALAHGLILLSAAGHPVPVPRVLLGASALALAVIGNFMGKTRSTFMIGAIRLPWTLTSEYAWEKSNRLAGRFFVATGIVTLAFLTVASVREAGNVLLVGVFTAIIAGAVSSYVYWLHDPNRETGDRIPE